MPSICFRGLRHTPASAKLSQGVQSKMATERLGHSDPTTIWRIYPCVSEAVHQEAAAAVDQFFSRSAGGRPAL